MITKKKRVILGEHDKSISDILLYLLNAWDYEVIIAPDGVKLLELVRCEHPDIIIIDSNLPKIDGLNASKSLKEDFLTAHIPVIILIDRKQIRKKMLEIEQGVDDYIANPPDPIDLEVRMEMALRRSKHQLHANALTRLPGNRQIEEIIHNLIDKAQVFSVAYYDIDNFKSFNDKYGYMKGDGVIKHTAYIISKTVKKFGNKNDFVGHIGGDDFIVITTPDRDKVIASESILNFNKLTPFHYSIEDRIKGYIISKDRRGNAVNAPLMSVSIAIVNNQDYKLQNMVELMETITEIKRYLKTLPGSNFLINRRGPSKKEFMSMDKDDVSAKINDRHLEHYRPLGQLLIESKVITFHQLEIALSRHWNTGQKIGQVIMNLGFASQGDITRALETQLDIPHFDINNLENNDKLKELLEKIPLELMENLRIIPVRREKNVLSVAMLNPKDIDAINKLRAFTGCGVVPFFVLENEFDEIWEKVLNKNR